MEQAYKRGRGSFKGCNGGQANLAVCADNSDIHDSVLLVVKTIVEMRSCFEIVMMLVKDHDYRLYIMNLKQRFNISDDFLQIVDLL